MHDIVPALKRALRRGGENRWSQCRSAVWWREVQGALGVERSSRNLAWGRGAAERGWGLPEPAWGAECETVLKNGLALEGEGEMEGRSCWPLEQFLHILLTSGISSK